MAFNYQAVVKSAATNGLVGLVAICLSLGLTHYGISIPPDQIAAGALLVMTAIMHAHIVSTKITDAVLKTDQTVRSVAALAPQLYPAGTPVKNEPFAEANPQ